MNNIKISFFVLSFNRSFVIGIKPDPESITKDILFEDPNITNDIKAKLLNRESVRFEAEFDFEIVVGVVAVLSDKDVDGILRNLVTCLDYIIVCQNSSARAMPADQLAKIASAARSFKRSGRYQIKEAKSPQQRQLRDQMKAHVAELLS